MFFCSNSHAYTHAPTQIKIELFTSKKSPEVYHILEIQRNIFLNRILRKLDEEIPLMNGNILLLERYLTGKKRKVNSLLIPTDNVKLIR